MGKQSVDATITITTEDGVEVPIGITIKWPDGLALYVLKGLNEFPTVLGDIKANVLQRAVQVGDASILWAVDELDGEEL